MDGVLYASDRLCDLHYDNDLYSAGCEEKIAVDDVVVWSTIAATPHVCTLYMRCNFNAADLGKSITSGAK